MLLRVLSLATVLVATTVAQPQQPQIDPALRARFGFLGPAILELTWGVGLLCTTDDGKGPARALVYNPRRGRIEVLRWQDGALVSEARSADGDLGGLASGDVDGDGVADVLTLTDRGRIHVDPAAEGVSVPAIEVGPPARRDVLRTGDLDGDGRVDAVVLTRDGLRIVTDLAGTPQVSAADPLLANDVKALHVTDADGDGALDVVLATADEAMGLWVRRGHGDGSFGPWIVLPVRKIRTVFPGTDVGARSTLVTIEGAEGRVVEYHLRDDRVRPSVELTTLPAEGHSGARAFAQLDADGDGDLDLVVADPEHARLLYLLWQDGGFRMVPVPALAGIDSLAAGDVDGDGKDDLLMTSAQERALAWKSGAAPLDAFPQRLPSSGEPLAAAMDGDRILLLARDDKRKATLAELQRGYDGGWSEPKPVAELGRLSSNPLRLIVADLAPAPGNEVAYVEPGRGLKVLLHQKDGTFVAPAEGVADVLQVEDGAVTRATHDGADALLVTRDRFARLLRFDEHGEPVVLAQDNGPEGVDALALGVTLQGGRRAFLDRKSDKLWIETPDGAPIAVDVPRTGTTHLLTFRNDVLLLGSAGVARVPFGGASWELERLRGHEPSSDDAVYYAGTCADLDGDGQREVVIADADIHGLHVLVPDGDRLRRALTFPVFEQPEASQRTAEPHELATGDLDGDGRQDLIVVCHDRVLLYRQEK